MVKTCQNYPLSWGNELLLQYIHISWGKPSTKVEPWLERRCLGGVVSRCILAMSQLPDLPDLPGSWLPAACSKPVSVSQVTGSGQAGQGHVDSFQVWGVKIGPNVGAAALQLPIAGTDLTSPYVLWKWTIIRPSKFFWKGSNWLWLCRENDRIQWNWQVPLLKLAKRWKHENPWRPQ